MVQGVQTVKSDFDDPVFNRKLDEFHGAFQFKFFHNVVFVGLHSPDTDVELVADLFVDKTFRKEFQDLDFTGCQQNWLTIGI